VCACTVACSAEASAAEVGAGEARAADTPASLAPAFGIAGFDFGGQLRPQWQSEQANPRGPLAQAVSLSPGMMLGETAMLDGGGRSGEAMAVGDTEVHSLDDHTLMRLREHDPLLYAQVYRNVALHLSQRLRAAAWAWRASTS